MPSRSFPETHVLMSAYYWPISTDNDPTTLSRHPDRFAHLCRKLTEDRVLEECRRGARVQNRKVTPKQPSVQTPPRPRARGGVPASGPPIRATLSDVTDPSRH